MYQLKFPPRTMTRKGEQLLCLSPEGRSYVDQVVQNESRGKYLELSMSIKERLSIETGVSFSQIQNYLRNKHQSIRTAQTNSSVSASAIPLAAASRDPSSPYLPIKTPPEDARRVKELILFADIPEAKLDRLHGLLHLTPNAIESEVKDWAEPLELPENRVLAWFRYQRKFASPKPEDVDELDAPITPIKCEPYPETTSSDSCSSSCAGGTPAAMVIDSDEAHQAETRVVRPELVQSQGRVSPPHLQTARSPSIDQLPTPTATPSTSPDPSESDRSSADDDVSNASSYLTQTTNSPAGTPPTKTVSTLEPEEQEITMENTERQPGASSLPTVGSAATARRESADSLVGVRTGRLFPVFAPQASGPPDAHLVSSMPPSAAREGASKGRNSWDADEPSHSRQSSWRDSSRQHQHLSSRKEPPWPYRDYRKGKAREGPEVTDLREEMRREDQPGLGPHRGSRPRPPRLQPHPYHVHSSLHHDRPVPSASISDVTTPSTSRSSAGSSTESDSMPLPLRGADLYRIIQMVTLALKDVPLSSLRMDIDSGAEGAVPTIEQNVERILEFNSWAFGAAKSLGVSLQDRLSQGSMPPPPNPTVSPNFRK